MNIETKKTGTTLIARVKGKLDAVTAPDFEKTFLDLLAGGEQQLLVNFSELEYISSAGLRSVLVAAKHAKQHNVKLLFTDLRGLVLEVFTLSGFVSILAVAPTEAEGLRLIGGNDAK